MREWLVTVWVLLVEECELLIPMLSVSILKFTFSFAVTSRSEMWL